MTFISKTPLDDLVVQYGFRAFSSANILPKAKETFLDGLYPLLNDIEKKIYSSQRSPQILDPYTDGDLHSFVRDQLGWMYRWIDNRIIATETLDEQVLVAKEMTMEANHLVPNIQSGENVLARLHVYFEPVGIEHCSTVVGGYVVVPYDSTIHQGLLDDEPLGILMNRREAKRALRIKEDVLDRGIITKQFYLSQK